MTLPRVALTTLGCKTNQFESAVMAEKLAGEGFPVVRFDDTADVYIINTCTVTARTDAESRRLVRRVMKRNPAARIVVTGCYAQVSPDELQNMPGVTLVIGNSEKRDISRFIRELGHDRKVVVSDISRERLAETLPLESFAEHTRAFLQVQNGCDSFCSYCIVPYARGRSRSVSPEDALAAVEGSTRRGFREVVLTGIHLSGYGRDLDPPVPLHQLLQSIADNQLAQRLRLGSLEPTEISDQLIQLIAGAGIICPHLHIPLQSGNDAVLSRMNRNYTSRFFENLVGRLMAAVPDLCLGLDLIAGFPGETEEEFQQTYSLIQRLSVSYLHVFPFSPRPGTPAATMQGQVPSRVVTERARLLRELSEQKRLAYGDSFIGKEVQVLVQSQGEGGLLQGLSRHYLPVSFPGPSSLQNEELTVLIHSASAGTLFGTSSR